MHKPYRGLIDPSGYNYGGQSLMWFEKYNHREYLNKVKSWPLNHLKYLEETQPIIEAQYQPYKYDEKITYTKPKSEIIPENVPHFFRRIQTPKDIKLQQTLYQPNQMWPKHKKYREKTSGQYLQYLDPSTDPYGYKESKRRTKNERKGLSYASNLMKFSFKEENILHEFDQKFQQCQKNEAKITTQTILSIILDIKQKYNVKSLDTFSKLFNHVQKTCKLSVEDFQEIYKACLSDQSEHL